MTNFNRFLIALAIPLVFVGCGTQESEYEKFKQTKKEFFSDFVSLQKDAFKKDITPTSLTKSYNPNHTNLRAIFPIEGEYTGFSDLLEVDEVSTMQDLQNMASEYAVSFEVVESPGESDIIIPVSGESISEALNPMVLRSKQYLYSLGLTEYDIQEMVQEADSDESALIPFTLALIESESEYYAMREYRRFSLIPSAYADWDWQEIGSCALQALGFDIICSLRASAAKTWTKAAMKKAFKTVACKVIGPVGAAIFVIDFAICIATS